MLPLRLFWNVPKMAMVSDWSSPFACCSIFSSYALHPRLSSSLSHPCFPPRRLICRNLFRTSLACRFASIPTPALHAKRIVGVLEEEEVQEEDELEVAEEDEKEQDQGGFSSEKTRNRSFATKFLLLTSKEKKELRGYAHGLGRKLATQHVGKAGVTPALAKSITDNLEAHELVKLKVLDNSPDDVEVVIEKLEEMTDAQVVGNVGKTFILYRPSIRKMAEKERKEKVLQWPKNAKVLKPIKLKSKKV